MNREETIKDVFNTMTEKQKLVVYFLIGTALKNPKKNPFNEYISSSSDKIAGESFTFDKR